MNGFQQCESLRRQSLCAVEHAAEITLVSRVLKATLLRPAVVYIVCIKVMWYPLVTSIQQQMCEVDSE